MKPSNVARIVPFTKNSLGALIFWSFKSRNTKILFVHIWLEHVWYRISKPGRGVQHCEDEIEGTVVWVDVILGKGKSITLWETRTNFYVQKPRWETRTNFYVQKPRWETRTNFYVQKPRNTSMLTTRNCVTCPQITTTWDNKASHHFFSSSWTSWVLN